MSPGSSANRFSSTLGSCYDEPRLCYYPHSLRRKALGDSFHRRLRGPRACVVTPPLQLELPLGFERDCNRRQPTTHQLTTTYSGLDAPPRKSPAEINVRPKYLASQATKYIPTFSHLDLLGLTLPARPCAHIGSPGNLSLWIDQTRHPLSSSQTTFPQTACSETPRVSHLYSIREG